MTSSISGWDLPPGVTSKMIDDQNQSGDLSDLIETVLGPFPILAKAHAARRRFGLRRAVFLFPLSEFSFSFSNQFDNFIIRFYWDVADVWVGGSKEFAFMWSSVADVLYVKEYGLLKNFSYGFSVAGAQQKYFVGNGIVVGYEIEVKNKKGEITDYGHDNVGLLLNYLLQQIKYVLL